MDEYLWVTTPHNKIIRAFARSGSRGGSTCPSESKISNPSLLSSNNIMYSKSSMHQKLWFFPLPKSSIPLRHRLDGLCYCWFMIHIIEYGDQEWLGSSLVPGYIPFQEIRSRSFSKSPRLHDDCRSVEWGPSPAPTLFWAGWKLSGGETRYREI